jgi:hypothetical protein
VIPLESVGRAQPPAPDNHSAARRWVETLVARACTEDAFLAEVLALTDADSDVTWEVLALLDQFRRRRQLEESTFLRIKGRLQRECLGYGRDLSGSQEVSPGPVAEAVVANAVAPPAPREGEAPAQVQRAEQSPLQCLQPGDVIKGRYSVVQIEPQRDALLIKALDKVRGALPATRQFVALHVLGHAAAREPDVMQRIYRLQSLAHPSIARIFDVDEDEEGGRAFFTMEWCDFESLQQIMARDGAMALDRPAALRLLRTLASTLVHVHARDLPHGDLSLANVFVNDGGELRLQGFLLDKHWQNATSEADGLAFASLAYSVLSRCSADVAPRVADPHGQQGAGVQRPPGLSNEEWRLMEDALRTASAASSAGLLAAFATADTAPGKKSALPVRRDMRVAWRDTVRWCTHAIRWAHGLRWPDAWRGAADIRWPRWDIHKSVFATVAAGCLGVAFLLGTFGRGEPAIGDAVAAPMDDPGAATDTAFVRGALTPAVLTRAPAGVGTNDVENGGLQGSTGDSGNPGGAAPLGEVLDLPRALVRVAASQSVAKIWVRRRGSLRGPVTFYWWTENGSAQPRDFTQILRRWEVIEDGARGIELHIPLMSDSTRTRSRAFYVKIGRPGRGAMLGSRTLAQVEMLPARTETTDPTAVSAMQPKQ